MCKNSTKAIKMSSILRASQMILLKSGSKLFTKAKTGKIRQDFYKLMKSQVTKKSTGHNWWTLNQSLTDLASHKKTYSPKWLFSSFASRWYYYLSACVSSWIDASSGTALIWFRKSAQNLRTCSCTILCLDSYSWHIRAWWSTLSLWSEYSKMENSNNLLW